MNLRPEPKALALALVLLAVAGASVPSGDAALEPCPVRFHGFPPKADPDPLRHVSLIAQGVREIKLLHPRHSGLFVAAVDASEAEPIYGRYYAQGQLETYPYSLGLGMQGIEWETAASKIDRAVSEISPGWYRVVLQYMASGESADQGAMVCLAISPSFEITKVQYLHHFQ